MTQAQASDPPYGWVVVWATFASLALIFGVSYSFAAFFESFAAEFAAKRADVSLVFGITGLVYFSAGIGGGMLSDRYGPRLVCGLGMGLISAGLLGASFAQSMVGIYWTYGVCLGLGIALVYTPSIGNVQPWFTARRGLASGIASSGIGLGTVVVPLLATLAIAGLQWRGAMRWMAVGVLLAGLVATGLLKPAPVSATPAKDAPARPLANGASLAQALRDKRFWWFYLFTFTCAPTMFIPFAHVSASARDIGINEASAVGLVGLIGIGSLVGRFAIGSLADRLGRNKTLMLAQISMAASYLLWMAAPGYPALAIFALWLGLSYGGIVSLMPAICMDMFGGRAISGVVGTLYSAAALGNLLGPVVAGAVFDRLGSYMPVLLACLALSAVSTWACTRMIKAQAQVAAKAQTV